MRDLDRGRTSGKGLSGCLTFVLLYTPLFSITNLKYWGHSETIIAKTLSLLNDLSANYACVRKLVNFEEIQFILNNHTVRYKF